MTDTRLFGTGISANGKSLSAGENNLAGRGSYFYTGVSATLNAPLTATDTSITLSSTDGFKRGDYCIINGEIVRFTNDNINAVLRGQFGTPASPAITGTTIKKVKILAMELRRPSILRASGHTFEYLGYGPGNYSTALPQVQVRTLSEREEFLVQSQERSCGTVVYTGMNNRGDFFIGNKRVSSATGQERTFDAPIATVTGEDPSRLSVIFDEVIIKERLVVEGGKSKTILSEFDGPVNFDKEVKINDKTTINGLTKINNDVEITSTTQSNDKDTGSLITEGGVGIEKT